MSNYVATKASTVTLARVGILGGVSGWAIDESRSTPGRITHVTHSKHFLQPQHHPPGNIERFSSPKRSYDRNAHCVSAVVGIRRRTKSLHFDFQHSTLSSPVTSEFSTSLRVAKGKFHLLILRYSEMQSDANGSIRRFVS